MLITSWGIRSTGIAGPKDPYFSNVVLLLNGQGVNGGTTWDDLSQYRHPMTSSGATTSTAQFQWGNSSTLNSSTSATNNYVEVTSTFSEFVFGADEFTAEIWFYLTTLGFGQILVQRIDAGGGHYPWQLWISSGNKLGFRGYDNSLSLIYNLTGTTTLTTGQWYFAQARRRNDGINANFELALNGTQEASGTATLGAVLYDANSGIQVGNYGDALYQFPLIGYWEDCRVTWKVARAFGVPTAAFPTS